MARPLCPYVVDQKTSRNCSLDEFRLLRSRIRNGRALPGASWSDWAEFLVGQAVEEVKALRLTGVKVGYAYSGGKDSIGLKVIMDKAGFYEAVNARTVDLEFSYHEEYLARHRWDGLHTYTSHHDWEWAAENPELLFPAESRQVSAWYYKPLQYDSYDWLRAERRVKGLVLGRRKADGNSGQKFHERDGNVTLSPMFDWTLDDLMAVIETFGDPLPMIYDTILHNGGPHPWPELRPINGSVLAVWAQIKELDIDIWQRACDVYPEHWAGYLPDPSRVA